MRKNPLPGRRAVFHVKHPSEGARAGAALLSLGALSALAELLLLREVFFLVGGTELAAAVVLAAWLLAGALGALASSRAGFVRPGMLLGVCAAVLPLQVFALRIARGVLAGPSGELPSAFYLLLVAAAAASPLPALLGAVFPAAARRLGRGGAARAYAIEVAGLGAGAGLTLVLASLRREHFAVALVAALFALCGALTGSRRRIFGALALALLVLGACGPWEALERASISFAFRLPGVSSSVSTPHGRAFSAVRGGEAHIHTGGGLSEVPLASANEAVELVLALKGQARSILIICDDPEGYARTLGTFPGTRGTILTPDPGMLEFRRAVSPFGHGPNVTLAAREPLGYLRALGDAQDVIILSAGAPFTAQNNRLFTLSFFELVHGRLSAGGVFAIELPYARGHVSEDREALGGSIWQTLGEVFRARRVALTQHAGSLILLASDSPGLARRLPAPAPGRRQARERLGLYAPLDYEGAYLRAAPGLVQAKLESRRWPVNTVVAPACYQRAISCSQRRFGPPGMLTWLWRLSVWPWLGAAALAGGLFFLLALTRRGAWGPGAASLGGGLCSMVCQVTVIYVFQSAHGLLYSHLGLLAGSFMLGALAGALYCRDRHSGALACGLLFSLALYTGALPYLLSCFGASSHFAGRYLAFPAVSAIAGLLTGALFPACANLVMQERAGRIYAADLAGAAAGALLAGLVLIPSLGLYSSAFVAGSAGVFLALPLLGSIIIRAIKPLPLS